MRTILSALLFSTLALSATARADDAKVAAPVEASPAVKTPPHHLKKVVVKTETKAVVKTETKTEVVKAEATPVVAKTEAKAASKPAAKPVEAPKVQPRKVHKLRRASKVETVKTETVKNVSSK